MRICHNRSTWYLYIVEYVVLYSEYVIGEPIQFKEKHLDSCRSRPYFTKVDYLVYSEYSVSPCRYYKV